MNNLTGVLDPQPGNLAFALFENDRLIFVENCQMHGRDAAILPDFIAGKLAERNLKINDVLNWTIGSGPGSFTFLRLVAALAAGWKFANAAMQFRCVPGALALAGSSGIADGESCGVLYDGRNKEILYFGAIKKDGGFSTSGTTAVLNREQAAEFLARRREEKLVCFESEKSAIEAILPADFAVTPVSPDPAALALNTSIPYDNDLNDLVYIRPAVFS